MRTRKTNVRFVVMVCFIVACIVGATSEQGAAAREMALSDCISAALQANRTVAESRENLAQARAGITEARSGFFPNLALSGSYNFIEENQTIDFPLPSVGTERLKVDFAYDYIMDLAVSQPLYTGGRLRSSYRISTLSRDIAEAELERQESDVALSVMQAFYSYLLAKGSVVVAEDAVSTAEEFLRVVRSRYEEGQASRFEVMRAEVEVSNLSPALISARNAVALAGLALKNLMALPLGEEIEFRGSFDEEVPEVSAADAVRRALAGRPELKILRDKARIADRSLALAMAGRLPTVAVTADYYAGSNRLSLDGDRWDKTFNAYLVVGLPIFDGFKTKSMIARSRSEIRQADLSIAQMEEGIELEVRSFLLDMQASLESLRSQEKNVGLAEEGLKIANDRYAQGVATNLDVMDAQLALTTARNNRIRALHDLSLAIAGLERSMGVLLEGPR
jgi:outer membrane protein